MARAAMWSRRSIVTVLIAPPLVYPLYTGLWVAHDALFGDGMFAQALRYESRRHLFVQFWQDWTQALPVLYIAGIGLLLLAAVVRRYTAGRLGPAVVAGLAAGAALGLWLEGAFGWAMLIAGTCAALATAALSRFVLPGTAKETT